MAGSFSKIGSKIGPRDILRVAIALFFVSPLLIWLARIDHWDVPDWDWFFPLLRTIFQAGLSALGSVVLGFIMATGALAIRNRRVEKFLEYWLLIPNLIPQIFLILAVLNLSNWLPFMQGGLPAVILTHAVLNSGLVALAIIRLIGARLSGFVDAAVISGARPGMIWLEVIVPALRSEITFLFLFVFSVCLTSFSIPLVLGGVHAANFEILIYETLRTSADWYRVIYYVLIQMLTLFVFGFFIPKPDWTLPYTLPRSMPIGIRHHLPVAFLPTAIFLLGWLTGLVRSAVHLGDEKIPATIWTAALNTLEISAMVGGFSLLLILAVAYVTPHHRFFQFMKGYLAPSSAITGFAFLLLPGESEIWLLMKIAVALTLVSFPLLFRWIGQPALHALEEQIVVARSLGASWSQILFDIVVPQGSTPFFRMAGLAAVWASGDFAISSIIAEGDRTFALTISSWMGAYRLDLASLMTVPLFAFGLVIYGFFVGAGRYVAR